MVLRQELEVLATLKGGANSFHPLKVGGGGVAVFFFAALRGGGGGGAQRIRTHNFPIL